jgi:hypothetical protein
MAPHATSRVSTTRPRFDNLDEIEDDYLGSGEVRTVADDESSAEEAAMHVIEDEG